MLNTVEETTLHLLVVLTSSGTDAYSAYSAAIGSLNSKHGGANIKVMEMLEYIKENVRNWNDEGEVADYMVKLLKKKLATSQV